MCSPMEQRIAFFFFVFWIYCFFNCDTSYWFLYVASVKVTSFLRSILIIFLKHPTKSALKIARQMINDGKWQYRSLTTFCLPCLRKNCAEKNERKFSNESGDTMHTSRYFKNYRRWCSQVFYSTEIPENP